MLGSSGFSWQGDNVFTNRVTPQAGARMPRPHHHVYVVELSKDVLQERKFRKCNPGYVAGKPCVYVGMTGLDPDLRFDKHKAGIQANAYVQKYGLRLLPDLYEGFNPMRYEDAQEREVEIGIDLRSAGFGVWQA
jgi:predicted GIY-YIG superfamily endonuclease